MTMETAVKSVFGPMGPTPGAEERIWKAIDKGLHGRAKAAEVRFRPRSAKKPLLIGAAAILALVLLTAAVIRHMPAERPESIHPADEAAEPSPEAEPVLIPTVRQIALINARVDGKEILDLTEEGRYLARAVLPEGYTVDHWEVNGEPVDAGNRLYTLEFDSEGVWKVEAVLREEKTVRCGDNVYLQFLDEKGSPSGEMYSIVCFEYDYTVPTTGELHAGGAISGYILPIIPYGMDLDYWLIDGVMLEADQNPQGILLDNLDRSVEIDAVLKNANGRAKTGENMVLHGSDTESTPAPARPEDDLPESMTALPENTAWETLDLPRDGLPYDFDTPAKDGHMHDWEIISDKPGNCVETGVRVYRCRVCEREYTVRYYGEHEFEWQSNATNPLNGQGTHSHVCIHCHTVRSTGAHQWTHPNEHDNMMVCAICGAVYYRNLPGGN